MSKRVLASLMAAFQLTSVSAQAVEIVGHGATRCAVFSTDIERDRLAERVYFAWAQGYMSAILLTRPAGTDDQLNLTPSEFPITLQMEFVRTYCAQRPTGGYSDAVDALYRALRRVSNKSGGS